MWLISVGYGHHFARLSANQVESVSKFDYACLLLGIFHITLPKYSVLFFYARLFEKSSRSFRASLYVAGAFSTAWLLYNLIFLLLQCAPIKKNWLIETPGHCHNPYDWHVACTVSSVAIDLLILLLPLPTLWNLHTRQSRKVTLTGLFICGYW